MHANDVFVSGHRPFIGRTHELSILRTAVTGALDGSSRIVLLAGEPGIGKTGLAEKAADLAKKAGMTTLWARCYEDAGIPTYWPWIQIVRGFLDSRESEKNLSTMRNSAAQISMVIDDPRLRMWAGKAETVP